MKCKYKCMSKNLSVTKFEIESTDQLISLMNVYLTEWTHRDAYLWKQVFSHFIACLVVMLLPFMTYFGIDFEGALPKWIFPSVGMVLAVVFYIVSKGYAIRFKAAGITYQRLIDKLPKEMQRTRTKEISTNVIYSINMSSLIVDVMFIALLIMGLVLLHICW